MFSIQSGNLGLDLLVNIFIFIIGTAVLVKGSDLFIDSAANIARCWGVSELVIGLTLVSIGTSLPELVSSIYASIRGEGSFIIGNIVGSNITNISLILAIGIIGMGQMPFERKVLTRDGLFMLLVYLVCGILFYLPLTSGHGIDRRGAIILLVVGALYLFLLFLQKNSGQQENEQQNNGSVGKNLFLLALGIVMITAGSKGMVDPAVWGAQKLGVSMLVISSTLVAFGTSVPELAVTLAGIIKKRHDIALGNILGSNIFNILLIFGITGCITNLPLKTDGIGLLNLILMGATGLLLVIFMLPRKNRLTRLQGLLFLLFYLFFMFANCRAALNG